MNYLNINSYIGKENGDPIYASTWNGVLENIQTKVNEIIDALSNGGSGSGGNADTPTTSSNVIINGQTYTSNRIVLDAGQDYTISGTIYGQLVFDAKTAKPSANTNVTFNGVTIISEEGYGVLYETPENNTGYKDLVINLAKDSENYVICNKVAAPADDLPGAIYSMNNLAIKGVGYLAVYNKGGHGIRGTETQIVGPHIYIDVEHDGVHGKKLSLDYGYYYIKNANDIFGTGDNGTILYGMNMVAGASGGYSGHVADPQGGHVYNMTSKALTSDLVSSTSTVGYARDLVPDTYSIVQSEDKNFTTTETVPTKNIIGTLETYDNFSANGDVVYYRLLWADVPGYSESGLKYYTITVQNDLGQDISDLILSVTSHVYNNDTVIRTETIQFPYNTGTSGEVTKEEFEITFKEAQLTSGYPKLAVVGQTDDYYWNITKPYVKISGEITKQIIVEESYPNGNYTTSDVDIYLDNAYLNSGIQFLPTSDRVKVVAVKDTVNTITNTDGDAISSENNIRVEVKNNAHLIVSAPNGDAIDGDEVIITDSKGTLLIPNYKYRGIKGTSIIIGPNAKVKSGTITVYNDPESADYSNLEGAVVVTGVAGGENEMSESAVLDNNISYTRHSDEAESGFDLNIGQYANRDGYRKVRISLGDITNNYSANNGQEARFVLLDSNKRLIYVNHSDITFPYDITEEDHALMNHMNAEYLRIFGRSSSEQNVTTLPIFDATQLYIYNVKDATNSGYASIYARQGKKNTKGTLAVTDAELKGVLIADSIGATIAYNAANASRFYYRKDVNNRATGIPAATAAAYIAKPYNANGIDTVASANGVLISNTR